MFRLCVGVGVGVGVGMGALYNVFVRGFAHGDHGIGTSLVCHHTPTSTL